MTSFTRARRSTFSAKRSSAGRTASALLRRCAKSARPSRFGPLDERFFDIFGGVLEIARKSHSGRACQKPPTPEPGLGARSGAAATERPAPPFLGGVKLPHYVSRGCSGSETIGGRSFSCERAGALRSALFAPRHGPLCSLAGEATGYRRFLSKKARKRYGRTAAVKRSFCFQKKATEATISRVSLVSHLKQQ